jgi:hypothetical protein
MYQHECAYSSGQSLQKRAQEQNGNQANQRGKEVQRRSATTCEKCKNQFS